MKTREHFGDQRHISRGLDQSETRDFSLCDELSERLDQTEVYLSKVMEMVAALPEQVQTRCDDLADSVMSEMHRRFECHSDDVISRITALESNGRFEFSKDPTHQVLEEIDKRVARFSTEVSARVADLEETCKNGGLRDTRQALASLLRRMEETETTVNDQMLSVEQHDLEVERRLSEGAREIADLRCCFEETRHLLERSSQVHGIDSLRKAHESGIEALKAVIETCKESLETRYRESLRRTHSLREKLCEGECREQRLAENERALVALREAVALGESNIAELRSAFAKERARTSETVDSPSPVSKVDRCGGRLQVQGSAELRAERPEKETPRRRQRSLERCGSHSPKLQDWEKALERSKDRPLRSADVRNSSVDPPREGTKGPLLQTRNCSLDRQRNSSPGRKTPSKSGPERCAGSPRTPTLGSAVLDFALDARDSRSRMSPKTPSSTPSSLRTPQRLPDARRLTPSRRVPCKIGRASERG